MECFIFEAAEKCLGIEIEYIYRIADDIQVTPVPLAPPCYRGVIYFRGDLFDVVDVGSLMGGERSPLNGNPYIILLKWGQRKLGLISDKIIGITWIEDNNGSRTVFTKEGRTVELITPEEIYKILSKLAYGP
ncbi:MAG: chemotaxis protein CheW [Desulfobacteraceae bacterium]|nr:chemotaxis protein CheW [Deltaproteobacteria bacterium]MBL6979427.1 chemotaxis protein CheW [Desulfobacteraceae bacterium]